MGNPHLHDSTTPPRMSVNVALCGSIPRSLMTNSSAPCGLQALSSMRSNSSFSMGKSWGLNAVRGENEPHKCTNNSLKDISSRPVLSERQPLAQIYEAPTWAVPAKGQTSLEVSTMDAFYGGANQSFTQHVSLINHFLVFTAACVRRCWYPISHRSYCQVLVPDWKSPQHGCATHARNLQQKTCHDFSPLQWLLLPRGLWKRPRNLCQRQENHRSCQRGHGCSSPGSPRFHDSLWRSGCSLLCLEVVLFQVGRCRQE